MCFKLSLGISLNTVHILRTLQIINNIIYNGFIGYIFVLAFSFNYSNLFLLFIDTKL